MSIINQAHITMSRRSLLIVFCSLLLVLLALPASAQSKSGTLPAPLVAPSNDNFIARAGITWTNDYSSNTVDATIETGEVTHPCRAGGASAGSQSVWYSFYVPAGTVTLKTEGSTGAGADTLMSVWQGTNLETLVNVACDDDGGVSATSLITTALTAGQYHVQISRYSTTPTAAAGTYNLTMSFVPSGLVPSNDVRANATVIGLPDAVFVQNMDNASIDADDTSTSCTSFENAHSVWFRLVLAASKQVYFWTSGDISDTVLTVYHNPSVGVYTSIACNDDITNTSRQAGILITLDPGTYYIRMASYSSTGYTGASSAFFHASLETVTNGGFETDDATWLVTGATGDKRKCNAIVTITDYGQCAFVFKGGVAEASTISQPILTPGSFTPSGNTPILLRFMSKGSAATQLKAIVKLKYTVGDPVKCKLSKSIEAGWQYNSKVCIVSTLNLTSAKILFRHTSLTNKVRLDDIGVSLGELLVRDARQDAPSGVLPPPAAPTGFRGGN